MKSLTFIDLFAGIGGFRRGFEKAGHICVGHCELDKYANTSYCAIHNINEGEWFCSDIRKARAKDMPKCDVWCFGAPCQDFSVAGKRKGLKGNRSSLIGEVFRLLGETKEEYKPKYIIYENVKGMFSSNKGFDFLEILYQMDKLGYDAEWEIINSKDYKVPQNRERVYVIGHFRERCTRKIFPIRETSSTVQINKIGELDCKGQECIKRIYDVNGLSPTLTTMEGGSRQPKVLIKEHINSSQNEIVHNLEEINQYLSAGNSNSTKELMPIKIGNTTPKGKSQCGNVYSSNGIYPTLSAGTHENVNPSVIIINNKEVELPCIVASRGRNPINLGDRTPDNYVEQRLEPNVKGLCNALTNVQKDNYVLLSTSKKSNNFRLRKLTPLECWRLQGWNDEDFYKAKKALCNTFYKSKDRADSQLYKQAGNGVTTNVIYEIAKRMQ